MWRKILLPAILIIFAATAQADDLRSRAKNLFEPLPTMAAAPAAKVTLGKMLFFDPRLSASQLISCNTCHNLGLGGADLQETSVGHGWQKGPRNAPTVLNSVLNVAQFWDGRAKDLAEQAKGPVQASVEMNNAPEQVIATLKSIPGYPPLFAAAFPSEADPVTFDNMAKAIEAFEATLMTPDAPFDRFLKGDDQSIDATARKGLALFIDKGCGSCHNGANIGGYGYFPFGLLEKPGAEILPPGDKGRYQVTRTESDQYVFKAPSLRNIELTPPYFHSGKIWQLREAVAVMGSAQLGISLENAEADQIAAFLSTLTGLQPRIEYPILPPNGASTPRPNLK